MDKQKQIEEMAKVVQRDMCGDVPCEECNYHGKMKILPKYCGTYLIAKKLYNAGYRKIPKNAVVLTREEKQEYEGLVKLLIYDKPIKNRVYEFIKDTKQQTRKETAEKFAELLKERFNKSREYYVIDTGTAWGDGQIGGLINDKIDKILKEITEGEV